MLDWMIKYKTFYFLAHKGDGSDEAVERFHKEIDEYDAEIQQFLDTLSVDGFALISINAVSFGRFEQNNRIITCITYRETPTRKVLVEKIEI